MTDVNILELSYSFGSLESRAESALSKLSGLFQSDSRDAHVRSIVDLLSTQHAEGSWGSDDYPILKAVFTAQGMQTLHSLGMETREGTTQPNSAYLRAKNWLQAAQRSDGMWGEDAFDTCETVKALIAAGVSPADPSISRGVGYLRGLVDLNWEMNPSFWSGTGFIGSAVEVFNVVGDNRYANLSLEQLSECFDSRLNKFTRGDIRDGDAVAAPLEWHTACALLGLRSFGPVLPEPSMFNAALQSLKSAQSKDGCWSPGHDEITSICTYEVIVALTTAEGQHSVEARRGTEWLLEQSKETGTTQPGYNAKFMAAAAVSRTHQSELRVLTDLVLLQDIRETLESCVQIARQAGLNYSQLRLEVDGLRSSAADFRREATESSAQTHQLKEQNDELRRDIKRSHAHELQLQQQLAGYGLKLTNNQMAIFGIILTLLTFFAGLFVALALNK
jgi:hypothetical protein